jgi:hypothetical protein
MKRLIIILLIECLSCNIFAQDYNTAIGVRVSIAMGLTVKHNFNENNAIEGTIASRWGGFLITGLYEYTRPFNVEGLNWYYGIGAHFAHWDSKKSDFPEWWNTGHNGAYTVIGGDGILGIEYTFDSFPMNVSLDWKPVFNFFGYSGLWADMVALSIRYTIGSNNRYKRNNYKHRSRYY